HPRPYLGRYRELGQDDQHDHRPSRVLALHPQVPALREAPQEHCRSSFARLCWCAEGRQGYCRPVPSSVEDCALQRDQAPEAAAEGLEAVPAVL
ncbi:hypothetical protein GGH17_003464, partial [Coemansia sp. RSA 788]